jgi:hypothetical protein
MHDSGMSLLNPLQVARQEIKRLVRKGLKFDADPDRSVPHRRFEEFKKGDVLYLAFRTAARSGSYEAIRLDSLAPTVFHIVSVDVEMGGIEGVERGPFAVPDGLQSESLFKKLANGEAVVEVIRFDCERQARAGLPVGLSKVEDSTDRLVYLGQISADRLSQYEVPRHGEAQVIRRRYLLEEGQVAPNAPLAESEPRLLKTEIFDVLPETRERFAELVESIGAHTKAERDLSGRLWKDLEPLVAQGGPAGFFDLFRMEGESVFKIGKTRYIAANCRIVLRISDAEEDQTFHVSLQASSPRGFRELIDMARVEIVEELQSIREKETEPLARAFEEDARPHVVAGGASPMTLSEGGEIFYLPGGIAYIPLGKTAVARVQYREGVGQQTLFLPTNREWATSKGFKRYAEDSLKRLTKKAAKAAERAPANAPANA